MGFALLLALVAPVGGALVGVVLPERAELAARLGAVVAAGCWLALLVDGDLVSAGRFHSVPLVAAAACGAALVCVALDDTAMERPALTGLALAAVTAGLAAGRVHTDGAGLVAGIAVGVAASAAPARPALLTWVPAGAGVLLAGAGVLALRSAANSWELPLAGSVAGSHRGEGLFIVAGAALLVLGGSGRARCPTAVLVPTGVFVAVQAAPLARGADGLAAAAIVLAVLALGAALAGRDGEPLLDRATAALAVLAVAALMGPGGTRGAVLLLASGATLATAVGVPAAASLGIPGGVALALALAGRGGGVALAEGALAAAVALALAAAAVRAGAPPRPAVWAAPALAAGAWLLVAPGSWAWVGQAGLRAYDLGAGRALAGAALGLVGSAVLAAFMSRRPAGWYARASPPATPGEDAVRH